MRLNPLPQSFFVPSAEQVAPRLLGHWLFRRTPNGLCGGLIVETEAYLTGDPACHAFRGRTERNRAMWGAPGHAYVYLIYGCHCCVNAVCRPPGAAEAVLIRALEPRSGLEIMRQYRRVPQPLDLTNGPAKLCAAMQIDRRLDEVDLCHPASPLWIGQNPEVDQFHATQGPIVTTARVGLSKATDWPLRFFLARNCWVSRQR